MTAPQAERDERGNHLDNLTIPEVQRMARQHKDRRYRRRKMREAEGIPPAEIERRIARLAATQMAERDEVRARYLAELDESW